MEEWGGKENLETSPGCVEKLALRGVPGGARKNAKLERNVALFSLSV